MVAGRYTLQREIGHGGMGAVWLAHDDVLDRQVAIKRVGRRPGAADPDMARVEREARLAAMLNHPHVVAVFDLVDEGDEHWLVMEYVEGISLGGLVRRDGPLSPDEAAPLIAQAAEALEAAHGVGIVHRDVKPSNILVTPSGQAKLTDFGIARAEADPSLTQTGMVTGSPAYLAPEVASGRSASIQSDAWSLGATLFHLLSGHPPYEVGDNLLGAMYRIVHEDPPRLAEAGWLAPLLENTMTHDLDARWSMADVRAFLDSRGATAPLLRPAAADTVDSTSAAATTAMLRPAPTPTTVGVPTSAPTGAGDARVRRRPSPSTLLALLLAVVLIGLVAWIWADTAPQVGDAGDAPQSPAATPSEEPSAEPEDEPTEEGMETFVRDYLDLVVAEPREAFTLLTPEFQAESGEYAGYERFWSRIRSARVSQIRADPERLRVSYRVRYQPRNGSAFRDDVTLRLQYDEGDYLIAGEG